MDLIELGALIKQARKSQNMTQTDLASLHEISRSTLSGVENGIAPNVGLQKFMALCDSLGLELTVQRRSERPTLQQLKAQQLKERKEQRDDA